MKVAIATTNTLGGDRGGDCNEQDLSRGRAQKTWCTFWLAGKSHWDGAKVHQVGRRRIPRGWWVELGTTRLPPSAGTRKTRESGNTTPRLHPGDVPPDQREDAPLETTCGTTDRPVPGNPSCHTLNNRAKIATPLLDTCAGPGGSHQGFVDYKTFYFSFFFQSSIFLWSPESRTFGTRYFFFLYSKTSGRV